MKIELNKDAIRKAESSPRIDRTGDYVGIFTKARKITSEKTGTVGIEFEFLDTSTEATADFLTVYTHKADGTPIYGLNIINAIMACLKLRTIESRIGKVNMWSSTEKKKVAQEAEIFPDLMNKAIGVVLQAEEYFTLSGERRERMTLVGCFEATTRLTASEIIDRQVTPQALDKWLASLPEIKKARNQPSQRNTSSVTTSMPSIPDDDIPF